MEIYRNETATIKLEVPVTAINGTFAVTATDGDTVLYTFATVTAITGGYTVALPFSLVDKDRTFTINWSFQYMEASVTKTYSAKTYVEVVTPYVTVDEIRDALGSMPVMTDTELKRVERRIRGVIENYTGQRFGRYAGAYRIQATGDDNLNLPSRLIGLTSIAGGYFSDAASYDTRGDGWYLAVKSPVYSDGSYTSTDVIRYPGAYTKRPWQDNAWYTLTGEWGYEDVPANVKEAALILIEDLICPDSEYRDRYVTLVKTAEFTYQYTPGAFRGTGSVIADQLLEDFRRTNLVVI
jgi:hypothetical protein